MTEKERRFLEAEVERYRYDVSEERRQALIEAVRQVSPDTYGHLMKSQCAYEFHMIIDALLDS